MNTVIHYPFGALTLESKIRAKRIFKTDIKTGLCSRNILDLCRGMEVLKSIPYIERIEHSAHCHYSTCFCMLIEKAAGIECSNDLNMVRTVLLEKERIFSHVTYLHRMFALADNYVLKNMAEYLINRCLDELEEITGSRTYSTSNTIGGLNYNFSVGNYMYSALTNNEIKSVLAKIKTLTNDSTAIRSQYGDLCRIKSVDKKFTGPFSWALPNGFDLRITDTYLSYDRQEVSEALSKKQIYDPSFSYGRIMNIIEDSICSCNIIDGIFSAEKKEIRAKNNSDINVPGGKYAQSIESPRGKMEIEVELDDNGTVKEIKISSPSEKNMIMALEAMKHSPADDIQKAFESLYISAMEIDR